MTVVGRGTFRVRSHNFSFTNPDVEEVYDHSVDMWDAKISWEGIRAKFRSRGGSKEGAATIEKGFNLLNEIDLYSGDDRLTNEEKDILLKILESTGGAGKKNFFQFMEKLSPRNRGDFFEDRVAALFEQLLFTTNQSVQYNVGKVEARAPQQATFIIDTTEASSSESEILQQLVMNQASDDYRNLVAGGQAILLENFGQKETPVLWRTILRQGKVDITTEFGEAEIDIQAGLSESIEAMAIELVNHTFSLKNYRSGKLENYVEGTGKQGGVALGYAKTPMRVFGSFYYGVTGDDNYVNACTFIYASMNSGNETVQRYMSWARFVYEFSGIGLVDMLNRSNGQLVDYLIVNNADTGQVRVIWIGSVIEDMPNGYPPYEERKVKFGYEHIFDFSNIS